MTAKLLLKAIGAHLGHSCNYFTFWIAQHVNITTSNANNQSSKTSKISIKGFHSFIRCFFKLNVIYVYQNSVRETLLVFTCHLTRCTLSHDYVTLSEKGMFSLKRKHKYTSEARARSKDKNKTKTNTQRNTKNGEISQELHFMIFPPLNGNKGKHFWCKFINIAFISLNIYSIHFCQNHYYCEPERCQLAWNRKQPPPATTQHRNIKSQIKEKGEMNS